MLHTCLTATRFARSLLGGVTLAALAGCAGENAQLVALKTLQTTVRYEQKIDAKIAAEKEFYRDQMANLRTSLAGEPVDKVCLPDDDEVEDAAAKDGKLSDDCFGNPDFKKSWLYGRILTDAQRDARRTAGTLMSADDGAVMEIIQDFAARGIAVNHEALAEVERQQQVLAQEVAQSLKPLEKQKKRLKTLRQGLTTLTSEPDAGIDLTRIQNFAEIIAAELQRIEATE